MDVSGVPLLGEEHAAGTGKLNRGIKFRQTSGTETGLVLADVEIVHVLETEAQVKIVESFLPGAMEAYHRAFGSGSDGKRNPEWRPSEGGANLNLSVSPAGRLLYDGRATVKRAVLRVVPKACVLTVYVRLESFDPTFAAPLLGSMGMPVDYELVATRIEGARGTDKVEGGLPFGEKSDLDFGPGDLVNLVDGDPAIVVSVAGGRAILRRSLVDSPEVVPFDVAAADVVTSLRICGPKGGPAADSLARLAALAPACTPGDLILALLQAQGLGETELLPQGWTMTSTVIANAAGLSDAALVLGPVPENDGNGPDDDLPPEAGETEDDEDEVAAE